MYITLLQLILRPYAGTKGCQVCCTCLLWQLLLVWEGPTASGGQGRTEQEAAYLPDHVVRCQVSNKPAWRSVKQNPLSEDLFTVVPSCIAPRSMHLWQL